MHSSRSLICLGAVTVLGQASPNLLADPSFEEWGGNPSSTSWRMFRNVVCDSSSPRTKSFMVNIYDNFNNETNSFG